MIDLECPSCARRGRAPEDMARNRLVCKKCHVVFHMTGSGRTVLGEPPGEETKVVREKRPRPEISIELDGLGDAFKAHRTKIMAAALVVAVFGYGSVSVMSGGTDSLKQKSASLSKSILAGDQSAFKSLAWYETDDAVLGYFNAVKGQLDALKTRCPGQEVGSTSLVMEENVEKRRGEVLVFLNPPAGAVAAPPPTSTKGARKIASPAPLGPTEVTTFWVLNRGTWKLDVSSAPRIGASLPAPSMR